MAYLAVNKDGTEVMFKGKTTPSMWNERWYQPSDTAQHIEGRVIHLLYEGKPLPSGTILALTGQKINWNDEPIKI